jgi:glutathione S-transferase
VPYKDYMKRMAERPAFAKVNADRKTNTDDLMAKVKAQMEKAKGSA